LESTGVIADREAATTRCPVRAHPPLIMAITSSLHSEVREVKQRLEEGRQLLKQRHAAGSPGIQICNALTDLVDRIVLDLWNRAAGSSGAADPQDDVTGIALIAYGGYGRRDLAPYSDIDLMILHGPSSAAKVTPLVGRFLRDLYDVGLKLGHSVRTPRQALQLAARDATICTTMMELRFLSGDRELFEKFTSKFRKAVRRRRGRIVQAIEGARRAEQA
jgi:[protein-PII] uridylyltransferase